MGLILMKSNSKVHYCTLGKDGVLRGLVSVWGYPVEIELGRCPQSMSRHQQHCWAVRTARKIYRNMK